MEYNMQDLTKNSESRKERKERAQTGSLFTKFFTGREISEKIKSQQKKKQEK
jgi:hypothetical protein